MPSYRGSSRGLRGNAGFRTMRDYISLRKERQRKELETFGVCDACDARVAYDVYDTVVVTIRYQDS